MESKDEAQVVVQPEDARRLEEMITATGERMLRFFSYKHLPPQLQFASHPFAVVAMHAVSNYEPSAERTAGLRKLLEAKDCIVRCALGLLLLILVSAPAIAQVDQLPLQAAVVNCSPTDVASWPITSRMTALDFSTMGVLANFDRRDGPDRWPETTPPGWDGGIQYTLWIVQQNGGVWNATGAIEFWYSRGYQGDDAGGNVTVDDQVARNWTFGCGGSARQPHAGEQVGFFVTQGSQRKKDASASHQRSNVVVVPFPSAAPAHFAFADTPPVVTPPPVVTTPPPVIVTPPASPVDLSGVLVKLQQLEQQNATDHAAIRQDVAEFRGAVRSVWQQIGPPLLKYVVPALAAFIGGLQVAK